MRKGLLAGVCALAVALGLSGCARVYTKTSTTFAMDSLMTITAYGSRDGVEQGVTAAEEYLFQTGSTLSVTQEDGEIFRLNAAGGEPVEVCVQTAELLEQALALCAYTGGALDITSYPAVKAWGFTTDEHRIPEPEELAELAARIDYTRVGLEGQTVTLPAGMELDLGAVAKGYAGDQLWALFTGEYGVSGITDALLNLGQSTMVAIGNDLSRGGIPWRIGVQNPAGDDYLGVLNLTDQAMGSSGSYNRYFEQDGVRYGHIMDPETAAPASSALASVTVVADSALLCDGLSTALYVMGLEKSVEFWEEKREFEALFITKDGDIVLTPGLEACFETVPEYEGEVRVLD